MSAKTAAQNSFFSYHYFQEWIKKMRKQGLQLHWSRDHENSDVLSSKKINTAACTVTAGHDVLPNLISSHFYLLQADELDAVARVGVPADHRGIVCDHHVFRILKQWIKAGEPDPFYNPLNDYVVLPTAFEIEKYCEQQGFQVATHTDDWDIVSPNTDTNSDESASSVHSQSEVMHLVRAVGVTASG